MISFILASVIQLQWCHECDSHLFRCKSLFIILSLRTKIFWGKYHYLWLKFVTIFIDIMTPINYALWVLSGKVTLIISFQNNLCFALLSLLFWKNCKCEPSHAFLGNTFCWIIFIVELQVYKGGLHTTNLNCFPNCCMINALEFDTTYIFTSANYQK